MKEVLKVSGILNIIISSIFFFLSIFGGIIFFSCFVFLLTSGLIFLEYSKLNDLENKRNIILILSIILIPINFASALMNFICIEKLTKKKSRAPTVDPETKKIDILIKIGIGLISLSGLIFISSGWNDLSKYIVITFLSILTIIFYLLYLLFNNKIKLVSSSKLYYILSHIFFLITYLSLGHYSILGNYFSTSGVGCNLFYSIFFIIASLVTLHLKDIINKELKYYTICICITLSFINILKFIDFTLLQSLVIIDVIVLFIWFKFKNKYISNYTGLLSKAFIIISGLCLIKEYSYSLLILTIINVVIINLLNIKNNNILYQISSPLITILYLGTIMGKGLYNYGYTINDYVIFYGALLLILYILLMFTNILKDKIISKNLFVITFNIVFVVLNIMAMVINGTCLITMIILNILYLFSYYFYVYRNTNSIEYYILPINIIVLMVSFLIYLNNYISINANIMLLSIIALLSLYYIFIKNKVLNNIIIIFLFIFNTINILVSLFSNNIIIISITLVTTCLPLVLLALKDNKTYLRFSFIYALITEYLVLLNDKYTYIISFILNIVLYIVLLLVVRKDKSYKKYIYLIISLPILSFISNFNLNYNISDLLNNIVILYSIIIFVLLYIKDTTSKNTLFIVFTSLLFISVIFKENYIFGIYSGIISLTLLIYSSIKDNKSIFIYSIVLLIVNILYRLKDLWYEIPLCLYLLIAGITIIVLATIKELKNNNKK